MDGGNVAIIIWQISTNEVKQVLASTVGNYFKLRASLTGVKLWPLAERDMQRSIITCQSNCSHTFYSITILLATTRCNLYLKPFLKSPSVLWFFVLIAIFFHIRCPCWPNGYDAVFQHFPIILFFFFFLSAFLSFQPLETEDSWSISTSLLAASSLKYSTAGFSSAHTQALQKSTVCVNGNKSKAAAEKKNLWFNVWPC